jgi:diacylglycerol kinase (ATP)
MTVLGGPVTALLEQGSTAEALAPCLITLLGAGPAWIGWCAEIRHERRHRRSDGDGARRLEADGWRPMSPPPANHLRPRLRKFMSRSRARPATPAETPRGRSAIQIVVTPGSGAGRALRTARRLATLLGRRGRESSLRTFANLAALRRWAETCKPDFSHLVCVGGDATMSAAAHAAIRLDLPFVAVPQGFGNVFARTFHYPNRPEAVAGLLEHGHVRRVDVGLARNGPATEAFLSHRSYGLLEQIQNAAERGRQQPRSRVLRYLWYYGVAYQFLFRRRLAAFDVEVDGNVVADDAVLVTVANVETYRGFLPLTPSASPIDGQFDVAVVPRVPKATLFFGLLRLLLRLPGGWRRLTVYRGRRVVVTTPRRREELTVRRRALPLLIPPGIVEQLRARSVDS